LTSGASEATQRLFFALWPDAAARAALAAAVTEPVRLSGGRAVAESNLHVTLAFLGSVAQPRVRELRQIASAVAAACGGGQPLTLRFDALAHWPRPQVLCLTAHTASPRLHALAMALRDAAAAAGFTPDLKPFHAHVTVARKVVTYPSLSILAPLEWRFDSFALIDSRTEERGPVYSVVESWPLVKAAKAGE
jgi:RNA 2',3'-cyclic 3'-phosphodiesterase